MIQGVTPPRAGCTDLNQTKWNQIKPPDASFSSRSSSDVCLNAGSRSVNTFFSCCHRRSGMQEDSSPGAWGESPPNKIKTLHHSSQHRSAAFQTELLTVSPVPRTITSYSSSMLYQQRLSRLALFTPAEMKGVEGGDATERPPSGELALLSPHGRASSNGSFGLSRCCSLDRTALTNQQEESVHTVTGEHDQRWP